MKKYPLSKCKRDMFLMWGTMCLDGVNHKEEVILMFPILEGLKNNCPCCEYAYRNRFKGFFMNLFKGIICCVGIKSLIEKLKICSACPIDEWNKSNIGCMKFGTSYNKWFTANNEDKKICAKMIYEQALNITDRK